MYYLYYILLIVLMWIIFFSNKTSHVTYISSSANLELATKKSLKIKLTTILSCFLNFSANFNPVIIFFYKQLFFSSFTFFSANLDPVVYIFVFKNNSPLYSGKQTVSGLCLIFSANRSFLLRNNMIDVSTNHLLLQMESKSFMLSIMRFISSSSARTRS